MSEPRAPGSRPAEGPRHQSDPDGNDAGPRYRLIPGTRVAKLGSRYFLYDARSGESPIVVVPTQRIRERVYELIGTIQENVPAEGGWTLSRIAGLFEAPADRRSVSTLAELGYLEKVEDEWRGDARFAVPRGARERARREKPFGLSGPRAITRFDQENRLHHFHEPTFFNVPRDVDAAEAEVGLIGIPFSSTADSIGTELGPHALRLLTQRLGHWHQIHESGAYTELTLDGGWPAVLGKGVVIKDFGDLGEGVRTVDDLMRATEAWVRHVVVGRRISPIFVGGDHAITFPVVHALLEHFPDLALVHLDAHNDLFYSDAIAYSHAAVVSNLLVYSKLESVHSFGLRTHFDDRVRNVRGISEHPSAQRDNVHLHSITEFRRLLAAPKALRRVLRRIGDRPCYLTIDLDVLSPGAIGGRLSTPEGPGLEWVELFEAVGHVLRELNVVGADIVELNLPRGDRPLESPSNPALLTLLLIDGLAARRR